MRKNQVMNQSMSLWMAWAKDGVLSGKLRELNVPDYITELPAEAFADCESLEYVNFSPNIKIIGEGAFRNCNSLKSIVIPEGTVLKPGAFSNCRNLTYVILSGEHLNSLASAFEGCKAVSSVTVTGGDAVMESDEDMRSGLNLFTKLSTIKFMRKVRKVDESVFANFMNLRTVIMSPNNPVYRQAVGNQSIVERETGRLIYSDYLCGANEVR